LQLAVYVTFRKVPLESSEGEPEAADRAAGADRTRPARTVVADEPRLFPQQFSF
jgi:hypothetical protein